VSVVTERALEEHHNQVAGYLIPVWKQFRYKQMSKTYNKHIFVTNHQHKVKYSSAD